MRNRSHDCRVRSIAASWPAIVLIFGALPAFGATLTVPSMTFSTIQEALTAAESGDTVEVLPGTYFENRLNFGGNDIVLMSLAGAATTIIDGGSSGIVFRFSGGETRAAVIDGFTIQNGSGLLALDEPGALFIIDASPTVRNNILRDNQTTAAGGAIVVVDTDGIANPLITNNDLINNTASLDGGAIHIFEATAEIVGNTIMGNSALGAGASNGAGGGVFATNSSLILVRDNIIQNNTAAFAGGGVSFFATSATIEGNTITGNDGGEFGGGVHIETQAAFGPRSYIIRDNLISDNDATKNGGGIHAFMEMTPSDLQITDNTITDNRVVDATATIAIGGGIGNIGSVGLGASTQTVTGNVIRGNTAELYGGALFANQATLLFEGNTVESNAALEGYAGLYVEAITNTTISRNTLRLNTVAFETATVSVGGGGLRIKDLDGDARVENNLFEANSGILAGAFGLVSPGFNTVVVGNTFAGNVTDLTVPFALGGASIWVQSDATLSNNVFDGSDAFGVRIKDSPLVTASSNDFFQNTGGALLDPANALAANPAPPTSGYATGAALNAAVQASANLDFDPLFVGPTNFFLMLESPLIDAGDCSQFSQPLVYLTGRARLNRPTCDIGALPEPSSALLQVAALASLWALTRRVARTSR